MELIIGLGNPGKKYDKTRHNIGFRAVDEIAANFQFPIFKLETSRSAPCNSCGIKQSIFNAQISKGRISGKDALLVKPQAFMNNSGKSVKMLYIKCKIQNTNLFVIHDDIDLPLGKLRISVGRSSAGHKGVDSIIKELKMKDFVRLRIGIKPQEKEKKTEQFVLQKFNKEEEENLKNVIKKIPGAIEMTIKEGAEKAMAKYN